MKVERNYTFKAAGNLLDIIKVLDKCSNVNNVKVYIKPLYDEIDEFILSYEILI